MVIIGHRSIAIFNVFFATLAALLLIIGSSLVTAALAKGIKDVNEYGNKVGIYAEKGDKFLALTWAATGVMVIAATAWLVDLCVVWRHRKRIVEKNWK